MSRLGDALHSSVNDAVNDSQVRVRVVAPLCLSITGPATSSPFKPKNHTRDISSATPS